jgi:phosphoketolase
MVSTDALPTPAVELGHWGTTPGSNLLYARVNRMIKARDLNVLCVTGPGHGGPGLMANAYLPGHRRHELHFGRGEVGTFLAERLALP